MNNSALSAVFVAFFLVGCSESIEHEPKAQDTINQAFVQIVAQDVIERRALAKAALGAMHVQSLYSSETSWIEFYTSSDRRIEEVRTDEDLKALLTDALNTLRDHHGRFIYGGKIFAHFTDWENVRRTSSLPTDEATTRRFELEHEHEFELLNRQVGYVKIKGIAPTDNATEKAITIRSNIEKLSDNGAKDWIVDLRYNTGGNMIPMLAGIGSLFCDGVIAGEADQSGDIVRKWSIRAGNFYYGENSYVQLPASENIECNSKVAVLISRYTASSGEAVATAFKGRPDSIFIGEPTAGYTTVTNWQPINDDLIMSISVSYYSDRNNEVITDELMPVTYSEFIPELPMDQDPTITTALEWISG